ncbi:MAG: hypothetical protein Q9217_005675 [Psora testacea]
MPVSERGRYSIEDTVRRSPPIDLASVVDDGWVKDKTILITGGASGFGEGFCRRWAAAGANVVIGDINARKGDQLIRDVSKRTGNKGLHFFHCDVSDWQSQVQLFKSAVSVSPHTGIDVVVANAGVLDANSTFESPTRLDATDPPPPNLHVLDVNLKGVLYTAHLALYWLPRNPNSAPANPKNESSKKIRDRHLLLLSSLAGLVPLPTECLYTVSKHAVVGLYRSLCTTAFVHGIRVNMLCPYFIDTPLLKMQARMVLAGGPAGKVEDVVEAATRFVADPQICGRAVLVGPKMKAQMDDEGQWKLVQGKNGTETAIEEIYARDYEEVDLATRRIVKILNHMVKLKGWSDWFTDMLAALRHGLGF